MFVVNGGEHCRKTHVVYRLQSPSHVLISTIRSVHCLARTATALRCQRGILIDRYLQLTQVGKYCLLPSHSYIIRVVTTSTITTRMHHISTFNTAFRNISNLSRERTPVIVHNIHSQLESQSNRQNVPVTQVGTVRTPARATETRYAHTLPPHPSPRASSPRNWREWVPGHRPTLCMLCS